MFVFMVLLCMSCAVVSQAQSTSVADKFLISAKAGGVNYLEGDVTVARVNGTSGLLLRRDRLEVGDRVTTGTNGRVEILMNPGSYVRLGTNSSFEFGTTDLEDLQVKLDSGSAVFEVFAGDEFRVSVATPKGKVSLIDTGIYRIDVSPNGTALLAVSKGKAEIGEGNLTVVKDGRTGTIGTETVAIAKFDKDKRDDLGQWSKDRSKELAKASSSLNTSLLTNSLLNGFRTGGWGFYDSFGLWVFSAQYGGYCFLPFGSGWRSPYGFWYYNGIYWNGGSFYPPVMPGSGSGGGQYVPNPKVSTRTPRIVGSGDTDSGPKVSTRNPRISPDATDAPPFTKVGRGSDGGFGGGGVFNNSTKGGDYSSDRSSPVFSPVNSSPPVSSPPVSAPAVKVSTRDNN